MCKQYYRRPCLSWTPLLMGWCLMTGSSGLTAPSVSAVQLWATEAFSRTPRRVWRSTSMTMYSGVCVFPCRVSLHTHANEKCLWKAIKALSAVSPGRCFLYSYYFCGWVAFLSLSWIPGSTFTMEFTLTKLCRNCPFVRPMIKLLSNEYSDGVRSNIDLIPLINISGWWLCS